MTDPFDAIQPWSSFSAATEPAPTPQADPFDSIQPWEDLTAAIRTNIAGIQQRQAGYETGPPAPAPSGWHAQDIAGTAQAGADLILGLPRAALQLVPDAVRTAAPLSGVAHGMGPADIFGAQAVLSGDVAPRVDEHPIAATMQAGADYLKGQEQLASEGIAQQARPPETLVEKVVRAFPSTAAQMAPFLAGPAAGMGSMVATTAADTLNRTGDRGENTFQALPTALVNGVVQAAEEEMGGPEAVLLRGAASVGLGKLLVKVLSTGIGEGSEEVVQAATDYVARWKLGEFDGVPPEKVWEQFKIDAKASGEVGGVLGLIMGAPIHVAQHVAGVDEAAPEAPWEPNGIGQQPPAAAPAGEGPKVAGGGAIDLYPPGPGADIPNDVPPEPPPASPGPPLEPIPPGVPPPTVDQGRDPIFAQPAALPAPPPAEPAPSLPPEAPAAPAAPEPPSAPEPPAQTPEQQFAAIDARMRELEQAGQTETPEYHQLFGQRSAMLTAQDASERASRDEANRQRLGIGQEPAAPPAAPEPSEKQTVSGVVKAYIEAKVRETPAGDHDHIKKWAKSHVAPIFRYIDNFGSPVGMANIAKFGSPSGKVDHATNSVVDELVQQGAIWRRWDANGDVWYGSQRVPIEDRTGRQALGTWHGDTFVPDSQVPPAAAPASPPTKKAAPAAAPVESVDELKARITGLQSDLGFASSASADLLRKKFGTQNRYSILHSIKTKLAAAEAQMRDAKRAAAGKGPKAAPAPTEPPAPTAARHVSTLSSDEIGAIDAVKDEKTGKWSAMIVPSGPGDEVVVDGLPLVNASASHSKATELLQKRARKLAGQAQATAAPKVEPAPVVEPPPTPKQPKPKKAAPVVDHAAIAAQEKVLERRRSALRDAELEREAIVSELDLKEQNLRKSLAAAMRNTKNPNIHERVAKIKRSLQVLAGKRKTRLKRFDTNRIAPLKSDVGYAERAMARLQKGEPHGEAEERARRSEQGKRAMASRKEGDSGESYYNQGAADFLAGKDLDPNDTNSAYTSGWSSAESDFNAGGVAREDGAPRDEKQGEAWLAGWDDLDAKMKEEAAAPSDGEDIPFERGAPARKRKIPGYKPGFIDLRGGDHPSRAHDQADAGYEAYQDGFRLTPAEEAEVGQSDWFEGYEQARENETGPQEERAAQTERERSPFRYAEGQYAKDPPEIAKLRREGAKLMHPDLAKDDADLARRTEFMKAVNGAADAQNGAKVRAVIEAWKRGDAVPPGGRKQAPPPPPPRQPRTEPPPRRPGAQQQQPPPRQEHEPKEPEPPKMSPEEAEQANRDRRSGEKQPSPEGKPATERPRLKLTMADLTEFAKRLGGVPKIAKNLRGARGLFMPEGAGQIRLAAWIMENPAEALRTFAHEIGHWIDYLDTRSMTRGNILGRVAVLNDYFKRTLDRMPTDPSRAFNDADRLWMRKEAARLQRGYPQKDYASRFKAAYKDVVAKELARRGLITEAELTSELVAISEKLRGPIPPSGPDHDYRMKSAELYADAFSAMLTNPELIQSEAPKFYGTVLDYFYRKPEVQSVWNDILARSPEESAKVHLDEARAENAEGAKLRAQQVADRGKPKPGEPTAKEELENSLVDRKAAFYRWRNSFDPESAQYKRIQNLIDLIEESSLGTSEVSAYVTRVSRAITEPLRKAGVSLGDFSTFLGLRRAAHSPNKFSPGGRGQVELDAMRKELGEEKWKAMEDAAAAWWKVRKAKIVDPFVKQGVESDTFGKKIAEDQFYVRTMAMWAIRAGQAAGIPGMSALKARVGTLQAAGNYFFETMMQDAALIHMRHRAETTEALLSALRQTGSATPARTMFGRPVDPKEPGTALIPQRKNGRTTYWVVPKEFANFYGSDSAELGPTLTTFNRVAQAVSNVFVVFNPTFPIYGVPRDVSGTYRTFMERKPGESALLAPVRQAKTLLRAMGVAIRDVIGSEITDDELDMLENRMLIAVGSKVWDPNSVTEDDVLSVLQDMFGAATSETRTGKTKAHRALERLGWALKTPSQKGERAPKLAAYRIGRASNPEWSMRELARKIRSGAGTPSVRRASALAQKLRGFAMFSEVAKEGLRTNVEAWRRDPALFASKLFYVAILPALLLKAAGDAEKWLPDELGGKELQEWARKLPSWVKEPFIPYPMPPFFDENGKAVYGKIPLDYFAEAVHRLTMFMLDGADSQRVGRLVKDLLPWSNRNPIISVPAMLLGNALGGRVRDDRGIPVLDDWQYREPITSPDRWTPVLKEAWNESPGSIAYRFRDHTKSGPRSWIEKAREIPLAGVAVGKIVGVSDYGLVEERNKALGPDRRLHDQVFNLRTQMIADAIEADPEADQDAVFEEWSAKVEKMAKDAGLDPPETDLSRFKARWKVLAEYKVGAASERLRAGLSKKENDRLDELGFEDYSEDDN